MISVFCRLYQSFSVSVEVLHGMISEYRELSTKLLGKTGPMNVLAPKSL